MTREYLTQIRPVAARAVKSKRPSHANRKIGKIDENEKTIGPPLTNYRGV
jgi:hypothetical protein